MMTFERRVILCQSIVRGFLVRRRMNKVRQEFEKIVAEIEGASALELGLLPQSTRGRNDRCERILGTTNGASKQRRASSDHDCIVYETRSEEPSLKDDLSTDSALLSSCAPVNLQEELSFAGFRDSLKGLNLDELEELKVKTAFELLWIQDSVQTRKDYLRS